MDKVHFGILFGSYLIGIPEIPMVPQDHQFWEVLDFEISTPICAKMVYPITKSERNQKIAFET